MGAPGTSEEGSDHSPLSYERFLRLRVLLVSGGTEFKGPPPALEVFQRLEACIEGFKLNRALINSELHRTVPSVVLKHLAFTCFAPGGRADRARMAVELMDSTGDWFGNPDITWSFQEARVAELATAITPYVRFPNQKALHFLESAAKLPALLTLIGGRTISKSQMDGAYEYMLDNMPGFGMKSAAHFLRNVGMFGECYAFPIIDVHIHKALESFGFQHSGYEDAQPAFCHLANLIELPVILLDAALWCSYANNWDISHADFDNFTNQQNKESSHVARNIGETDARGGSGTDNEPRRQQGADAPEAQCGGVEAHGQG